MGFRSGFRGPRSARTIALPDSAHFPHFQRLAGINFQPDASAPGPRFSLAWPFDELSVPQHGKGDLHYRIPDPANVVPPSFQQPPLLPGTPAGFLVRKKPRCL